MKNHEESFPLQQRQSRYRHNAELCVERTVGVMPAGSHWDQECCQVW